MIIAAQFLLGIFLLLCGAGISGGVLLCIAFWYDRRCSRGWRRASEQQRRTILEIKF